MHRQVNDPGTEYANEITQKTNESKRKRRGKDSDRKSTFQNLVPNPESSNVIKSAIFTIEEEAQLAKYCQRMGKIGYKYNRWQVLKMAGNMMKETGRSRVPTEHWFYNFVRRYPDLEFIKPSRNEVSTVYVKDQANIDAYFSEFTSILETYNLKNKLDSIWNIDETGIILNRNPPNIISSTRFKPLTVTTGNSEMSTVIAAGSALGETLPPYVISKGEMLSAELILEGLPGSKYNTSQTGWPDSVIFDDFLFNHFAPNIKTRPCLLLYDGHSTHITTSLQEKARQNGLHLFVFPAHCIHKPDVSTEDIFKPFKVALITEYITRLRSKAGKKFSRQDLPQLISRAYESGYFSQNLMLSFKEII